MPSPSNFLPVLSDSELENRYTIKIPQGETLFTAEETSESWQRSCCCSNRAFSLVLYDQTRQFSMQMNRRLACSSFLLGCWLQKMEVWIPPGEPLGTISQRWTLFTPLFWIENDNGMILYQIEGPRSFNSCLTYKDCSFNVSEMISFRSW